MFDELSVDEVQERLDRKKIAGIAVVLIAVLLVGSVAALESQLVDRNREFNVSATVEPPQEGNNTTLGVNTGQAMQYGNLTHDTNFTKFIEVGVERKSILQMSASGNISEILYFQERQYFEGSKNLSITAGSENPGRYEGKLELNFQVPESRWGARWLDIKYRYF